MIREIEELSMNAWPTLYTKLYDGWVLRFADGYTRRANAVITIYESVIPIDEKIDFCEKEYASYNLPAIFKITNESNPEGIDVRLEERGYVRENETALRILDMSQYTRCESQGIILDNILGTVICVSKRVSGKIVGCGFGAVERDYVGIFNIVIDKDFRGNGYGKDIMNGILRTASEKNIRTAYL